MDYRKQALMDASDFVLLGEAVPGIIQEIRYYSTFNFIGDRIDGYEEPVAILTREAGRALKGVAGEMNAKGYRLKVFDAYRPASSVRHFILWGIDDLDLRMKPYFYPDLEKQELFKRGYIAKQSSHSRGSAVDLTLVDMITGKQPRKCGRSHTSGYEDRQGSRYGKPFRSLQRSVPSFVSGRHAGAVREPDAAAEGDGAERFRPAGLRVVAFHAEGRAVPGDLF